MGKKYNTVAQTATYNLNIEPMFEYTAYEGIKPSRAKAIVRHNEAIALLEAEMLAERPSNRKPKTDKRGRRPRIEVAEREVEEGPHECDFQMNRWEDVIYHHSGWVEVIVCRCECGEYRITPTDPEIYLNKDDHAAQVWVIKSYKRDHVAYVSESYEGNSPFKKLDR
jgi:hypothetical protein